MLQIGVKTQIDPKQMIGVSVAILGTTGTGKTNTARILTEQMVDSGFVVTIIDPDGEWSEYFSDNNQYKIFRINDDFYTDDNDLMQKAIKIAEQSMIRRKSVIFDISDIEGTDESDLFLVTYFEKLFKISNIIKKPYCIVIEEAHELAEQGNKTKLSNMLSRIGKRGRKRGLSMIVISQRSASVDKQLLSQMKFLLLHRVIMPVDRQAYRSILPLSSELCNTMIKDLKNGSCIILNEDKVYVDDIYKSKKQTKEIVF